MLLSLHACREGGVQGTCGQAIFIKQSKTGGKKGFLPHPLVEIAAHLRAIRRLCRQRKKRGSLTEKPVKLSRLKTVHNKGSNSGAVLQWFNGFYKIMLAAHKTVPL